MDLGEYDINRRLCSAVAAKICTAKDERSQTVRSKVINAPGKMKKETQRKRWIVLLHGCES